MAKQLNVDLNVRANTSQAKNSLMELQGVLSKISSGNIGAGLKSTKIKQASAAAKELSIHLNNAFNATTGNFDLSKLDRSLKTSKQNITQLSSSLLNAGATGEQAFVKLAQTIAQADRPIITLSSRLSGLATVLKNTIRWQISSSLLHGFIGSVNKAYGYAEDLNKSLNNIRIVTGKNIDQMAQFAEQANKAAKALSASTTAYTDAALIYYQQGLTGDDVLERANITIKMANVSGQSAEEVSNQMTSVWNNFYDGSKSLEYYADVMTALGAATASSTTEIATGLEKFAAVSETVGLSYEYATAALATVTATTRQSADVVGTAFKTLFARIQGLNLGETLDDGTTLNKYSEALNKVGISIFDQYGQMKAMDDILDEMGAKWGTLSKDQQVALAQTVAGVRQYTQLIALMDHYDFFKQNLGTATDAEGTLQNQADIYAESWEAARKRVQASLQSIYSDLLDDKFFIKLYNGFASLMDSLDAFIDGIGGVKTVLLAVGSFFLSSVANKIQPALLNLQHTFSVMFQSAAQQARGLAFEMNKNISDTLKSKAGQDFTDSSRVALQNAMATNVAKAKLQIVEKNLTDIEKQRFEQKMSIIELQQKETQEVANRITKLKQEKEAILNKVEAYQLNAQGQNEAKFGGREVQNNVEIYRKAMYDASGENDQTIDNAINSYLQAKNAAEQYRATQESLKESTAQIDNIFRQMGNSLDMSRPNEQIKILSDTIKEAYNGPLNDLKNAFKNDAIAIEESGAVFTSYKNQLELVIASMPKVVRESKDMQDALQSVLKSQNSKDLTNALEKIQKALNGAKIEAKDFAAILKEINPERYKELETNANQTKKALEELKNKQDAINRSLNQFKPQHVVTGLERITSAAAGLGQVAMLASSVRSIFNAWSNDDLSFGEKITTTFMSISMIIPSLVGALKNLNIALFGNNTAVVSAIGSHKMFMATLKGEQMQNMLLAMSQEVVNEQGKANRFISIANALAKKGLIATTDVQTISTLLEEKALEKENAENVKGILIDKLRQHSRQKLIGTLKEQFGSIIKGLGKFVAAHPVAIAATAALALSIWAIVKAYKAEGEALKSAQEGAENAKTAYQELKTAYEDLNQSIADYQDAYKALKKLEEGAEGYQEALEKSNEAARKLIEANGLFDDWHYDDKGAIVFNEGALEAAKNEAKNKANAASLNVQAANVKYIEAQKESITPWAIEGVLAETLGSVSSEVFDTVKQAVEEGTSFDLKAEDLNLTTEQLSNLITAINLLGNNAENVYNQLTKLNQQSEYYAESFALSAAQMNGIYGAEGEENAQKAYANLIAQDDKYQQQLKDNAEKAKHATDDDIISALYSVNKDTYNSIIKNGIFSDEELARLYMRDVKGWSEQDAAAAVYKGGNGKGTLTLGDQSFEYNDQQMRNELLTKYLADQMAQNLGANGEDQAIKDILDLVSGVSNESENGGKTSDGEAELLNSLMNYKEGESISIDWGEMTPDEYTAFMANVGAMSGNAYAEAFNDVLVDEEQQRLMYENAQRQKEAAELESIFAAGAEATGMSEAALESYAESLMEVNEMTDEQRILAAKAAVQHAKLAKGLNKIQKAYDDYKDVLEEADEESLDFHEAVGALAEAMTEAFGMEIDGSFVKDNLDLIKEACNGSEEALVDLRAALNEDFIMSLYLETEGANTALLEELERMSALALDADITTPITMDNGDAIAALNEALITGQATIQDIEAMFNNANLAMPEYKTKQMPGDVAKSTSVVSGKLGGFIPFSYTTEATTTTMRSVPYFGDNEPTYTTDAETGETTVTSYGGGAGTSLTTTSTGDLNQLDNILDYEGDDSDKGKSGKNYKPEEDRYHRITKEIEKQERALKRLQTAKDNAFGANKLKLIDDEITALENLKAANEELYDQQQKRLNEDAGAVLELFPEADFSQGYLSNYNELLMQTTSEEQKKILDQYVKTWDDINNTYDKIIDFENQIKDRKYEDLNYKLELEIEIDDSELKLLELQLSQYEDSFYHLAESAALMSSQGELYKGTLELYKDHWDSLKEKFDNQDITQEKYIEGLKNTRDGIYDQLEALISLDKEMLHFYEDTLSSADDEVDKFMSKMEHLTSVFDHYLNLMDILGKSKDYEAMGNFLGGKADTIKDRLDSASAYYDVLLDQKAEIEAKLNKAIEDEDKAAIKSYQKEWDAIVESTNKAEDEVLTLTAEWAEAMKAVVENEMNSLADTLEKSLTKGLGFETLMDNFDKLNTYQEEFLTKTNQMYETSKLMRTANKALDATDNKVAKEKLKNFINETEALQNNTRLSKTELEIQQAKYDLLLAEIALEEAQNAKSTVRLSRDNEGNFGYVYTADENKIADAEQGVADADNKLYNLSLEKQQEYTQKYLQAQQQMYDEMTQLHQDYINGLITEDEYKLRLQGIQEYYYGSAEYNAALEELNRQYHSGEIASEEEYNRKKAELLEKYQGQEGILTVYSSQYNSAVSAHAAAAQDNWQTEYGEMTTNTSDWKIAVNKYLGEVQGATDLWKTTSITANGLVKGALNDSETATKNLKEESSKLKDKLNDEVIPAVGNQLTKVGELTKAYGEQRTELQLLITQYSDYITKLNEAITAASRLASVGGDVETPPPAVTNPTPSGNNASSGAGNDKSSGKGNGKNTNPTIVDTTNKKLELDEKRAEDDIKGVKIPDSAFDVGQRLQTKERFGFIQKWSKSGDSMYINGAWDTLGWHAKLGTIEDKFYYNGQWYYKVSGKGINPAGWIKGLQAETYDTGGYTGKWGPEGKLAMLHQKELVLNAQDTENMLAIVSAVRAIMDSIDVQASWASNGLGMLTAAGYNSMSQNLEQTVTIHAEFPNATNHSEIEEAFNALINRASQYANRK